MQYRSWLLKALIRDDNGAIIILWALLLSTLLGAVGLGLETTSWYATQRDLQKASDSAAIAAAYAIGTSNPNYVSIAQAEYTRIGLSNVSVTVNQPPVHGTHVGDSNAIEIIATENINTSFSQLISSVTNVPISARSVVSVTTVGGGSSSSGSACVLALSNSTGTTVTFDSTINVNVPGCTIVSNSTSSQSILFNSNVTIGVGSLYTVGNIKTNSGDTINNTSPNVTSGTAIADPFSSLTVPAHSTCNYSNQNINSGSVTLNPGVYCGGVNVGGTVTLNPGTYIFTSGLNINSGGSVTGNNVTLIFTGCNTGFSPNGPLTITAPTTGTYAGIAFYQDKSTSGDINFNKGLMNITGIIYAPSANFNFDNGSTVNATCTKIVASKVTFNSGANFSTSSCPSGYPVIAAGSGSTTSATGEALVE